MLNWTLLLLAFLAATAGQAGSQTAGPDNTASPDVDCVAKVTNLHILRRILWTSDPEREKDDEGEHSALTAECFYGLRDYARARTFYEEMPSDWNQDNPLRNLGCYNCGSYDWLRDSFHGLLNISLIYWHKALTYEALHDGPNARRTIRVARRMTGLGSEDQRVIDDYQRLDSARLAQQAAAENQARKAFNHEEQKGEATVAKTDEKWLNSLSQNQRRVFFKLNHPCHISTSDNALGHMEIWWYGCGKSAGIGTESFTFRNGTIVDHTRL